MRRRTASRRETQQDRERERERGGVERDC